MILNTAPQTMLPVLYKGACSFITFLSLIANTAPGQLGGLVEMEKL